ncbi:type I DNA topoisomerase [bacterium]|nr:type I DNA topoisomerase [bacterium]
MGKKLVIVESPTKGKTIKKFLSSDYIVEASFGHVRDLPTSATEIPPKLKSEEWTKLGVNVEKDFEPLYVIPKTKRKRIKELKDLLKNKDIDEIFLATDEDREGESISWHLLEVLQPKVPVKRMVFHEITKSAILAALQSPRKLDEKLVRAQETRRVLDRLVGYTLSPLIWKKIAYGLSAGRVQSVALRMIVDRERARMKFKKAEYWDLKAEFEKDGSTFESRLHSLKGKRIASGKDFDENTGKPKSEKDVEVLTEKAAKDLLKAIKSSPFKVTSVEEKPLTSKPLPPFITSTMQQEANRKLGLSSRDAMRTAQQLYEQGFITYMRTDSPTLSSQATKAAQQQVVDLYGKEYLATETREFKSKAKGAQEAHEAIRPAGASFAHPKETGLSGVQLKLYELIWKRTLASQMALAKKQSMSVRLVSGDAEFAASGTRIVFPGYLRVYVEGSDDPNAALEDREVLLPDLVVKETVKTNDMQADPHETKPPSRFTEAALIQVLEKEGIGRPSTYASIISTLIDRSYVRKNGNAMNPTFTGMAVTQLLEKHFSDLVDPSFTSKMESSLDEIAEGELESLPYLKSFYLGKDGLQTQVENKEKKIDADESRSIILSHLKNIDVKVGRYGAYMIKPGNTGKKKDDIHASIPETYAPSELTHENVNEIMRIAEQGPDAFGVDPKTGKNIYVLTGRYGPYFQLGEQEEGSEEKPRRAQLPKGKQPSEVTMEDALLALSLPRDLGKHPDSGKPIQTAIGRFGPFVVHDGDFRSLKKDDNVYTIDLKRALELLSEEKKGRGGSKKIKSFGEHPTSGNQVDLFTGRYGPYIKHGKTNATVPKGMDPEKLTTEEALAILVAKEGTPKKKAGAKKAAKKSGKKSVVRKKAAKKSPAKSKSK